jgi:hypothetical protein
MLATLLNYYLCSKELLKNPVSTNVTVKKSGLADIRKRFLEVPSRQKFLFSTTFLNIPG